MILKILKIVLYSLVAFLLLSVSLALLLPSDNASNSPETTETPDSNFAIATVKERYEVECFSNLGDGFDYRYESSAEGLRDGFVYVNIEGDVLQFAVGLNEDTGMFLTIPHNDFTTEKLTEAGC